MLIITERRVLPAAVDLSARTWANRMRTTLSANMHRLRSRSLNLFPAKLFYLAAVPQL